MTKPNHFIVHHRFHDNIACLIETLQEAGYSIRLFVILKTKTETYDLTEPIISPPSSLSSLGKSLFKKDLLAYIPSVRAVFREYRVHKPEYVLIRPLVSGIGLVHFFFALWHCKKVVLYSQSPKYRPKNVKNDFFLKLILALPKTEWITPVKYRSIKAYEKKQSPHQRINYVQLPHKKVVGKSEWFKNDLVNLLLIAKAQSYKNHSVLIEALKGLDRSKYKLLIAGDYSNQDAYTLQTLQKLESAKIHCEFLGYIKHSQISEIYKESDLLILPSSYEMHGYVVNEAMAYSVPVIVSSETGTKCLVEDGINGFVFDNNDSGHLRSILVDILKNRDQLIGLSEGCKRIYGQELSPVQFLNNYERLLGQKI